MPSEQTQQKHPKQSLCREKEEEERNIKHKIIYVSYSCIKKCINLYVYYTGWMKERVKPVKREHT